MSVALVNFICCCTACAANVCSYYITRYPYWAGHHNLSGAIYYGDNSRF
jgi:hypothetical protein